MGNALCCRRTFCQREAKPVSESEQEALLRGTKICSCSTNDVKRQLTLSQKSIGSEDLTDPRKRIDSTEVCQTTVASTKSISEKNEQENCPQSKNVLKTMQSKDSNQLLNFAPKECKNALLPELTERNLSLNFEEYKKKEKRAKLSHYDSDDSSHHEKLDQVETMLHSDEGRAKKLESDQFHCETEGMKNDQQSEEPVTINMKGFEHVFKEPDSSKLGSDLCNNEVAVATNTGMHLCCNQEGNDGEDLYRDEDEIEKDKSQRLLDESQLAAFVAERSTIEPSMAILEYCRREWKGNTAKSQLMRKAYEAVSENFNSIRRVRGDNYCALRATLFQALNNVKQLPCLEQDDLDQLPDKLIETNYVWIKDWNFGVQGSGNENPVKVLKGYLTTLQEKCTRLCEMDCWEERRAACENLFKMDTEEYKMFEAVKIMMLTKAIKLDCNRVQEKEVPLFCWLMFARDTSTDPFQFMKNHLNHVGNTCGLDQVEMFLLGYALQLTIRVFRLYQFGTDEFISFYPDDHKADWPMVTLITEDDRHYNVLVKDAQVNTS
ncbi:ubiquitin thioesterase otulin-like isoform X2 [Narcine bancroftii]|uniref:ubiquitin thioesterase otulin-like isoform X2 n=1 Tax=Narcine bancroftii TaxID=1343680 RepID=UPI0038315041